MNTEVFTPLFPCINKNLPPEKSEDPKGAEIRENFDSVSGLRTKQYFPYCKDEKMKFAEKHSISALLG